MYLFVAHYIDIDTEKKISKSIELDGQLFASEKDIYVYAMIKAYDLMIRNKKYNLTFDNLEFISC